MTDTETPIEDVLTSATILASMRDEYIAAGFSDDAAEAIVLEWWKDWLIRDRTAPKKRKGY
jgi:hypothetical protein